MTITLSGSITVTSDWDYQQNDSIGNAARDNNAYRYTKPLTNGTGANQANFKYADRRTVNAPTSIDDIDLYGLLTDVFGRTLNPVVIKEILIVNLSPTSGQNLLVGNAAVNPVSSFFNGDGTVEVPVHAGGCLLFSSPVVGYAITSGSADVLRVAHAGSTGAISFDIIIKGTV